MAEDGPNIMSRWVLLWAHEKSYKSFLNLSLRKHVYWLNHNSWALLVCSYNQNEIRHTIDLSDFGFYANGTLDVHLYSLRVPDTQVDFSKYPVSRVCVCVCVWLYAVVHLPFFSTGGIVFFKTTELNYKKKETNNNNNKAGTNSS